MEVVNMSAPSTPTWLLAAGRRRSSYADLRISDAERSEVADLLSQHYGDGRLDQAEFNERLDQAMKAKTYKDLSGLFADLPPTEAAGVSGPSRAAEPVRHRRHLHLNLNQRALFVLLVAAIAIVAGHALVWSLGPWAWIGLLVVIALVATRSPGGRGRS
jgi:Domain of unknown function (DUF1707)